MLKLVNVIKDYKVGGGNVINALRGVSMEFRQSEFVSVLGPSGCGKTTLLNIIGGLDHATTGDLLIYNKSTKKYKDRDWDVYRNHRIGFVFQSYNLIPHQTVLGNVELSLTIAGLSKAERIERAKKALDKVGLSDQYNKKPNQLSGGQSQRVAIARALVNDPEILLADEPTGALDTVTSKQIMELVKEISKERLVIMVTHNGEIAEKYSTRIIRLLDGNLLSDTNPFSESDARREAAILDKKEKEIQAEYGAIKADILEKEDLKNKKTEDKIAAEKLAEEKRIEKKVSAIINKTNKNTEKLSYEDAKAAVLKEKTEDKLKRQALKFEKENKRIDKKTAAELKKKHKKERAKMSFLTALKLSLKNLFSKKARTIMTSIAGSIGIIGVSLVLAISSGVTNFIDDMQIDMLSGYPIEITKTGFDINALMDNMSNSEIEEELKKGLKEGYINVHEFVETLLERGENMSSLMYENTINKDYVNFIKEMPKEWLSALFLDYGLDVNNSIYTSFKGGGGIGDEKDTSLTGIKAIYTSILKGIKGYEDYVSLIDMISQSFKQAPDTREPEAKNYIEEQYNILDGRIAREANEIMIVLGKDRVLNDLLLAQLGYYSQEEFLNAANKAAKEPYNEPIIDEFSYETLKKRTFTWYPNNAIFKKLPEISAPVKYTPFEYTPYADALYADNEGLKLSVVGILEPKEDSSFGTLSTGFYYTTALAEEIIEQNKDSVLVEHLQKNGESYTSSYIESTSTYTGITFEYKYTYDTVLYDNNKGLVGNVGMMDALVGSDLIPEAFKSLFEGERKTVTLQEMGGGIEILRYRTADKSLGIKKGDPIFDNEGNVTVVTDEAGKYFALPYSISIYPKDLDQKENVIKHLDKWNSEEPVEVNGITIISEDRENMAYSDMLGIVMSMIKQMVQIITIALVGFTSLALVVSCVMIGIITYVSVVERTKEIGVIRSLGGRKRDVSNLFIAETGIIGLISGVFGIIVTYLLSGVINLIVRRFADIGNAAIAALPWWMAAIMIGISVGLTLLSGLFPSRAAAKKDPVVALRTE